MRTKQKPGAQTIKYKYFPWQARAKELEAKLLEIASYNPSSATEEIISTLDEEWRFVLGPNDTIALHDRKRYDTREKYVDYLATIRALASNALEVETKCLMYEMECLQEDKAALPTKATPGEVKAYLDSKKVTKEEDEEEQGEESQAADEEEKEPQEKEPQEADDDDDLPLKRARPPFKQKNTDGGPAKAARTTP